MALSYSVRFAAILGGAEAFVDGYSWSITV